MEKSDHILLLGGTYEARLIAEKLTTSLPGAQLTVSFAGVVKDLPELGVPTRVGGFGGTNGLADFLKSEKVTYVVDATHPFASQISGHAAMVCTALQVPLIRLERPAWDAVDGDDWVRVPSIEAAERALPVASRVFIALGRKEISKFYGRDDIYGLARMIEPPERPLPAHWDLVLAHPAQSADEEIALFRAHGISHVVSKNSGGERAYAKIEAARRLHLPVIMIDRPDLPKTETSANVGDLLERLKAASAQAGS